MTHVVSSAPAPFTSIEPPSKIIPRTKDRNIENFRDARWHNFIEIERRILVSPRVVIPIHNRKLWVGRRASEKSGRDRGTMARLWDVVKRDSFEAQSA